jgi:hypothetical protein
MQAEPLKVIEFVLFEFVAMLHPVKFRGALPAPVIAFAWFDDMPSASAQFAFEPLATLINATARAFTVIPLGSQ